MKFETYKTYSEQVSAHIDRLRAEGLYVDELKIVSETSPFTSCHDIQTSGRGEKKFAYKTTETIMRNGNIGLLTRFRGKSDVVLDKNYY